MTVTSVLSLIEQHPAMHHSFAKMAEHKWPPDKLAGYLREMGGFCDASRLSGRVAEVLRREGMGTQADLIDEIIRSEAGHGEQFAFMAKLLLAGSPFAEEDWLRFAHFSEETLGCVSCFQERTGSTVESAFFSLGVMTVVELAAHRTIIPVEVRFFLNDLYGLKLEDVPYLAEHAGEHGAEHQHEETILTVLGSFPAEERVWRSIEHGAAIFLERLGRFYDRLEATLSV